MGGPNIDARRHVLYGHALFILEVTVLDLPSFFHLHPSGALALSGGVDSALLAWAAGRWGENWRAYFVHTAFQPAHELADARTLANLCGLPLTVLEVDVLADPQVAANPPRRCYYCKRTLFAAIAAAAKQDGLSLLADGTNASDDDGDRPGMAALEELGVCSPLRQCGLTKSEVRRLSREAGLPTWDKPAYACLATRVPAGTPLTEELLEKVERGEALLTELGFRDFRLRLRGAGALLQVTDAQLPLALDQRKEIMERLSPLFAEVGLDLRARAPSQ